MFSDIKNKAIKDEKAKAKEDEKRLEAFLTAIAKLEEEHHCEIQAVVRVTPSAIIAMPQAVVHPIPEPSNAAEAPTNPAKEPGQ